MGCDNGVTNKYPKLVRDRVPEIIAADGTVAETVILAEAEFLTALREKLVEEAREAAQAEGREALLTELADVLEVLHALAAARGATMTEVEALQRQRRESRGGFDRKLQLTGTRDATRADPGISDASSGRDGTASLVMMVYDVLHRLPRHDWRTPGSQLPENGVYIFFERGELIDVGGRKWERIVRVGTHTHGDNFRSRIRQHYGPLKTVGGSRSGSVFRKHVGGALLQRSDPSDPRLQDWQKVVGKFPEVEAEVSQLLRDDFTFVCFPVGDNDERLALESGLIALLAQHPLGTPSSEWLGRYARDEKIRESGLWNVHDVDGRPLTMEQLERIQVLASEE